MRKLLVVLLAVVFAAGLGFAQEKATAKKPTEKKITGNILGIDEAKSTILIEKGNDKYVVAFGASTKWTHQVGKKIVDAQRSDFKVGARVNCLATADEKGNWVASRIDLSPRH